MGAFQNCCQKYVILTDEHKQDGFKNIFTKYKNKKVIKIDDIDVSKEEPYGTKKFI